jgi:hypothetical protein
MYRQDVLQTTIHYDGKALPTINIYLREDES